MKPVLGFVDVFGADLRRRRFLGHSFGLIAESFGFEPLEVPIVEQAAAYSEEIVGLSPWPEWNVRGIFSLDIENYSDSYSNSLASTPAVLIPEGTLSVTRWLGDRLSQLADPLSSPDLPLKIYYEVGCYRNELLSTLSPTKGRQFTQFGIEILGSASIASDLEVMCVSAEALRTLGVSDAAIRFRISSNKLYKSLTSASAFDHRNSIALKEHLDTMGECKAGKRPERLKATRDAVLKEVDAKNLSTDLRNKWVYILDRTPGPIVPEDYQVLAGIDDAELSYLDTVCKHMAKGALSVDVDFCVVRSHEYYTGLTFEIDLLGKDGKRYVEVGGGGRYDRLLGNFVESKPGLTIPSMGYAFGLERLQSALVECGYLGGIVEPLQHSQDLSSSAVVPLLLSGTTTDPDLAAKYLSTVEELRARRLRERVSVGVA